ncbi:zinc ribbon domain-containing protein [Muricauda sp. 2012CJ35-5]|uniref:Zinc ribbon domain-containing protein n=1 Tax=Flagellimonas spongiicola TaxID=2942208 RepID=A0ABT0PX59_9FLAO|nr:zinc-ribbon domain-containing protein [Allomuricauda spongiicola]MCL6275068.1 zinc ribbon domain-containing protein [Allomuricauda spongiicola]
MIFFFGTRTGKKVTKQLVGVNCPHCHQTGSLTAISQTNFIHLFWIPIIPIGTSQFAECGHCKRGFYKEEFSQEMKKALQDYKSAAS